MSSIDTNQASEDDRPRAVQNGMSQEEYDTWMFLSDKAALDEPYTYMIKQSDLTKWARSLIRTEKLKLLAEVRERVVGEGELHVSHVCPQDNIGCAKFSQRCQTRNHQNAELTKLEAEL